MLTVHWSVVKQKFCALEFALQVSDRSGRRQFISANGGRSNALSSPHLAALMGATRYSLEAAFADGGVHLVVVPVDCSENMRVLVDDCPSKYMPAALKIFWIGPACGGAALISWTHNHAPGCVYPIGLFGRSFGISETSKPAALNTSIIWFANCVDFASKKLPITNSLPFGTGVKAAINLAFCSGVIERGDRSNRSFSSARSSSTACFLAMAAFSLALATSAVASAARSPAFAAASFALAMEARDHSASADSLAVSLTKLAIFSSDACWSRDAASFALEPNINSPAQPATMSAVATIKTLFSRGGISLLKTNNATNSTNTPIVTAIVEYSTCRDAASKASLIAETSISPIEHPSNRVPL